MKRAVLVAILALSSTVVSAQEPTSVPTPAQASLLQIDLYQVTAVLVSRAPIRPFLGARASATYDVQGRGYVFARIDGWALPDAPTTPILSDPRSFSTLEGYLGLKVRVLRGVSLGAFGGTTVPLSGGEMIARPRPSTWAGAVFVGDGTGRRWGMVGVGRHEAAGPGTKVLVSGQVPIRGALSAVVDGAVGSGGGSFVRAGLALRVTQ